MPREESPLSEEQLDLMVAESERNVESAYSFFRQLLDTDNKPAPDYFAEEKAAAIRGDISAASDAIDSELSRIADNHISDQALGRTSGESFAPENTRRLMKAGIAFLILGKIQAMLERAKRKPAMAVLSTLSILSGKLKAYSRSMGSMQLEDAYAFYHYDAYPACRALCEALSLPYGAELEKALADREFKEALGARLRERMKGTYGDVGDGEKGGSNP